MMGKNKEEEDKEEKMRKKKKEEKKGKEKNGGIRGLHCQQEFYGSASHLLMAFL